MTNILYNPTNPNQWVLYLHYANRNRRVFSLEGDLISGLRIAYGSFGKSLCSAISLQFYVNYSSSVVTENIHDLYCNLVVTFRELFWSRDQFKISIFLGTECLPLVVEDIVSSPDFFFLTIFDNLDDFFTVSKVVINRPVINPVAPFFSEHFS